VVNPERVAGEHISMVVEAKRVLRP
jgi:hypothetical protein